jgi:serine/threonine-protein kinase
VEDGNDTRVRLSESLHETLCAELASVRRIHVIAAEPDGVSELEPWARRLGANLVLQGRIRSAADEVRVSFTLIDPTTGHAIGGGAVRGSLNDVFSLEDRLLGRVRAALGMREGHARVPRIQPRDPAAQEHFVQALRYLERPDHEAWVDGAIGLLSPLAATEDESAPIHATLARAYLCKHDLTRQPIWHSRAAAAADRAAAIDANHPLVLLALADLHAASSGAEQALAEYQKALASQSDLYEAQLGIARVLKVLGRHAEAEMACRRAIVIRPNDVRGYKGLGQHYFEQGQYSRAIEPWRKILEIAPDNAQALSNLGSAYFHLDRHEDAIAQFRRSLELRPNPAAYTNLGTVLFFLKRYEEATDCFERAVALRPSDPVMHGNLGNACRFVPGREKQADDALRRAIDLMRERLTRRSDDPESWSRLAGWFVNRGQKSEATAAIATALSLDPDNVHCMVNAGHVYHQAGDRDRALHWFGQAVRHGYGTDALGRSPDLASLRGDPDFERILTTVPPAAMSGDEAQLGQ